MELAGLWRSLSALEIKAQGLYLLQTNEPDAFPPKASAPVHQGPAVGMAG